MTLANRLNSFLVSAVIIATTLLYGTVHQPTLLLFYFVVSVMLVTWAIDCFLSGTFKFSRSSLQLPAYLTAVYAFIQIVPLGSIAEAAGVIGIPRYISKAPFSTETTGLHYVALGLFLSLSLVSLDSASRLRKLVSLISIFGFAFAFFAILQSFLSPLKIYGIYESRFATPFGSFVNRHDFAAYMEMTMSVPLGLIFVGAIARDKRLLYITTIALMGVALLLSGSRGGFVAMIGEIFLLIIFTTRSRGVKRIALQAVLAVLLIGSVVAGAYFVGGESSLTRFAELSSSKNVTANRTQIWDVTLKVIANNLPLGAGLGAFPQAYTPFDPQSGLERVEQSHNDYLQVLADAGIVGLVIGGLFLFWFFREGIKNTKGSNTFRRGVAVGAFAGCFAILVHSMFDFVLHITAVSVLFLTLMAMLVASGRKYEDDIEEFDAIPSKHHSRASVTPISDASYPKKSDRPSST